MTKTAKLSVLIGVAFLSAACRRSDTSSKISPEGSPESAATKTLAAGAKVIQDNAPVKQFDAYLVGFHPMKSDPGVQMEAHHYCHQVNEDFMQCVLFDGNTANANMTGVEYIISEKLFNTLPADEKHFWHPHNYEILSGELIGPGLPAAAEKQFMQRKMNSYGKTWHFWRTESNGKPGDTLPLGQPNLAWSFNRDGEVRGEMIKARDGRMHVDSDQVRKERQDLIPLAHPQSGVDDLKGKFGTATHLIPGVIPAK